MKGLDAIRYHRYNYGKLNYHLGKGEENETD